MNYCSIILSYYWAFNWNGPIIFFSIIKQTFSNDCNYLKLPNQSKFNLNSSFSHKWLSWSTIEKSFRKFDSKKKLNERKKNDEKKITLLIKIESHSSTERRKLFFRTENVKQNLMIETIKLLDWLAIILLT